MTKFPESSQLDFSQCQDYPSYNAHSSTSSDTGQEEVQRSSEPLPRQRKRVSWSKKPSEIFYTPMMNDEDKELCYYSSNDFRRLVEILFNFMRIFKNMIPNTKKFKFNFNVL